MTTYLKHVDGLRAFAVLIVLLFHFKVPGFEHGYLGVDIFFVISGFLVTGVVIRDYEDHGKLRFGRFLFRRVRRLFPALAVTCAITFIAAYIIMDSASLARFGESLSAAIISLSNILFWAQSGYFDVASETKPLLHTWSLSVEEQFYLIWPLTLSSFALMFGAKKAVWLPLVLLVLSLSLCIFWLGAGFDAKSESTVFYWMPFRVYELMIGAGAFFVWVNLSKRISEVPIGLNVVMSIIAICLLTISMLPTSWLSLVPLTYLAVLRGVLACFGASIVILFCNERYLKAVLVYPPIVWCGQISYSLYLVHWPIWVFASPYFAHELVRAIFMMSASFVAAALLYYSVENPLRRGWLSNRLGNKRVAEVSVFVVVATSLVVLGMLVHNAQKLPFRGQAFLTPDQITQGMQNRFEFVRRDCNLTRIDDENVCKMDRSKQVLVIGNSHEPDIYNSLKFILADESEVNLISFGTVNGCSPRIENGQLLDETIARNCRERSAKLEKLISERRITHIAYGANRPFAADKEDIFDVITNINERIPHVKTILFGGFVNTTDLCSKIINSDMTYSACFDPTYVKSFPVNERADIPSRVKGRFEYLYIDRFSVMCADGVLEKCEVVGYGEPFSYDEHHITFGYSRLISDRIASNYFEELVEVGLVTND
ncbi:MAG: acyltransferase [Henriciella sp.]|nr:acyltransferase [Henriciella sp.]